MQKCGYNSNHNFLKGVDAHTLDVTKIQPMKPAHLVQKSTSKISAYCKRAGLIREGEMCPTHLISETARKAQPREEQDLEELQHGLDSLQLLQVTRNSYEMHVIGDTIFYNKARCTRHSR